MVAFAGVSHKGHVSKNPVLEEREANRLRDEAVKRRKDAARDAATRKRERKERHDKECRIAHAEGRPRPAMPESTKEEEDSSDVELDFSDDDEVATGADSPPVYPRADGEGSSTVPGEARLTPGSLVGPPTARTEQRSPTPAAGQRLPASTVGRRSSTPVAGQRASTPGARQRSPTPAASERAPVPASGSGGSAASTGTPA